MRGDKIACMLENTMYIIIYGDHVTSCNIFRVHFEVAKEEGVSKKLL